VTITRIAPTCVKSAALIARLNSRSKSHFGRRLTSKIFPGHAAAIAEAFSALTAAEQDELARLTKKLGLGRRECDDC
jgi:hypothetical protein